MLGKTSGMLRRNKHVPPKKRNGEKKIVSFVFMHKACICSIHVKSSSLHTGVLEQEEKSTHKTSHPVEILQKRVRTHRGG